MCAKFSRRLLGGEKSATSRISIKPLGLPRTWTKVLRLGPAVKVTTEEFFEVKFRAEISRTFKLNFTL